MTIDAPRCPALHPDLPYARCRCEEGHSAPHRTFTDLEWENTMHPDGRLTWNNRDDMEGGVTAAAIEQEVERLTQQINNQAHNAREDQRVIEEQERQIQELRRAEQAEGREGEAQDELVALRNMVSLAEDRAETAEQERDWAKARVERVRKHWKQCEKDVALWKDHAEKAEIALADVHERDETVARLEQRLTESECHDCVRDAAVIETMRPMRAEDITDEMVERGLHDFNTSSVLRTAREDVIGILTAALTEPPTRPNGAKDIEALLAGSWPIDREGLSAAADDLAMNGVRVVTEEE